MGLLCALGLTLGGCTTTSSRVMVGQGRAPIDPASVKLYLSPPASYEEIAMITADSDNSWTFTQQEKMETVIERLKIEAAAVGANGVLIRGVSDRSEDPVILSDNDDDWGVGYAFSELEKSVWAVAIFVSEDDVESLFSILQRRSPFARETVASID